MKVWRRCQAGQCEWVLACHCVAVQVVLQHRQSGAFNNLAFVPGLLAQLGNGTQVTVYSKSSQPRNVSRAGRHAPTAVQPCCGAPSTPFLSCRSGPPAGTVRLPNVRREGHTFLAQLHFCYSSLADVTVFVMDSAEYNRWGSQHSCRRGVAPNAPHGQPCSHCMPGLEALHLNAASAGAAD